MKNILFTLITLFSFSSILNGEDHKNYHEFQGKITGGLVSLLDSNLDLESRSGSSLGFEFGYHYSLNSRWGFCSGLGFSFFDSEFELYNYEYTNGSLNDSEGDPYTSYLYLDSWVERVDITFLEIPVVATYQKPLSRDGRFNLYLDLGFRIGIPISSQYEVLSGSYEDQGYYEQYDLLLKDIPGHFEIVTDYQPAGNIDLKTAFMLTSLLGGRYTISDRLDLLGGFRFSTTLNDMKSSGSNSSYLTTISSDRSRSYKGLLNTDLVDNIRPIKIGFELGVNVYL